jgi:sterol desaturase/sphingolipid hydroxylase (fatty acid hydroxylase superfamily)
MTTRQPPRYALALLERLVPGSASLAGDLIEEYAQRPSRWRVWREVLSAIANAWFERADEIRPLHLVDLQPADAIERTRQVARRVTPVNMTASPLAGISGAAFAVLLLLMTAVMPALWWLFAASIAAGVLLGVLLIVRHRNALG